MTLNEVWQHFFLMITFIALVISGFALRFSESWLTLVFFGWDGGFELRGLVHRTAAVFFMVTVVWHGVFLFTSRRGRAILADMMPGPEDFMHFWRRILYNLGRRGRSPRFGRFSYVEKAEYWALIWGSVLMILTGFMLWNPIATARFLPGEFIPAAKAAHSAEALLAALAVHHPAGEQIAGDGGDLPAASGGEEGVEGGPAATATGDTLVDELDGWDAACLSVGSEAE